MGGVERFGMPAASPNRWRNRGERSVDGIKQPEIGDVGGGGNRPASGSSAGAMAAIELDRALRISTMRRADRDQVVAGIESSSGGTKRGSSWKKAGCGADNARDAQRGIPSSASPSVSRRKFLRATCTGFSERPACSRRGTNSNSAV